MLGDIVDDESATNSDRLRAAALLLDRGYGKPSQVLNHRGEGLKAIVPVINFGLVGETVKVLEHEDSPNGQDVDAKLLS